jgi:hypothetical protein
MFAAPSADGFVGNDDATLEQHFLDIAQAQIETEIEPDGAGHDVDRIAVVFVSRAGHAHRPATTSNPAR